ncbi:ENR1 protein, partial [Pluvianellus socialis]|nr:ENR1 protein [Pluvianellus socialis]
KKQIKLYKHKKAGMNAFSRVKAISKYWETITSLNKGFWKAPDGLFWVCGQRAYPELHPDWKGTCTLGLIQTGFFLSPLEDGDGLGVPL